MSVKLMGFVAMLVLGSGIAQAENLTDNSEVSSTQSEAGGKSSASAAEVVLSEWEAKKPKLSGAVLVEHYAGFKKDVDPYNLVRATLNAPIGEKSSLSIYQVVKKAYYLRPGEAEWQPADTSVYWRYNFYPNWQSRLGASAPISQYSRDHEVGPKPRVDILYTPSLMDGRLSLLVRPFALYHINRYRTTVTDQGAGGGRPLLMARLGLLGGVTYNWAERFSTSLSGGYIQNIFEPSRLENETRSINIIDPPTHTYSYDVSMSYQVLPKKWSLSLGVSHEDLVEQQGGLQTVMYDELKTVWYLASTLTF